MPMKITFNLVVTLYYAVPAASPWIPAFIGRNAGGRRVCDIVQ